MKAILQRVSQAKVEVNQQSVAAIDRGILVLLCIEANDTEALLDKMLHKILNLRIFADEQDKMNLSLQDIQGGLLLVSQFTLAADLKKGNRPGFSAAAPPQQAKQMFELMLSKAKAIYPKVASGIFAADMQVQLINDGPVTIPIELH